MLMRAGGDLHWSSCVYALLTDGWPLIHPEPDMDDTCTFMRQHLLRCIHADVQDDDLILSGHEAGTVLAACLKHWAAKLPATEGVMIDSVNELAAAFRSADEIERRRLINGCIEHAFESRTVRAFFDHWKDDPELGEAHHWASAWADAQPPES